MEEEKTTYICSTTIYKLLNENNSLCQNCSHIRFLPMDSTDVNTLKICSFNHTRSMIGMLTPPQYQERGDKFGSFILVWY